MSHTRKTLRKFWTLLLNDMKAGTSIGTTRKRKAIGLSQDWGT